jgi:hypothetical protein
LVVGRSQRLAVKTVRFMAIESRGKTGSAEIVR